MADQAEQVRQRDDALAEKTAYVAKLEWRLLCQQKALKGTNARKPPLACPKGPAARQALPRKPRLAGALFQASAEGRNVSCHCCQASFRALC